MTGKNVKIKKMKKQKKQEKSDLEEIIKRIRGKFGEGAIMTLKEKEILKEKIEVISTGSISLDKALGIGGVPRGRVIEIFGPEASGKTTLALHILAEAQKLGGVGAFIDAEHAFDPEWAKKLGVKIEELLISQPDSGEEALQIAETLIHSGQVDVIVIDSVAALVPKVELGGEMGETQIGLQARLMSHALRKLSGTVSKTKTCLIFLNQVRMKIGPGVMGAPETTPGGLALKFYASLRIQLKRVAQIKKGEEVIGTRIEAKVVKNKLAPPFKTATFDIYYDCGISKEAEVIQEGIKTGVIKKSGAWLSFENLKLGEGTETARQFLKSNPEIFEKIKKEVFEKEAT
jgi:recombination protein RecA